MVATGLYCVFTPIESFMAVAGWVVGFTMLIDGIGRFMLWWDVRKSILADPWLLISSIISIVLGIIVLFSQTLQLGIDVFIIYYVAVWLVITGIVAIVQALRLHKLHSSMKDAVSKAGDVVSNVKAAVPYLDADIEIDAKTIEEIEKKISSRWVLIIILGILLIVFGIICIFRPAVMASMLGVLIGLGIIITGIEIIYFCTLPMPELEEEEKKVA